MGNSSHLRVPASTLKLRVTCELLARWTCEYLRVFTSICEYLRESVSTTYSWDTCYLNDGATSPSFRRYPRKNNDISIIIEQEWIEKITYKRGRGQCPQARSDWIQRKPHSQANKRDIIDNIDFYSRKYDHISNLLEVGFELRLSSLRMTALSAICTCEYLR